MVITRGMEIGLIGGDFINDKSTTLTKAPKSFSWAANQFKPVTCFVDHQIAPNAGKPLGSFQPAGIDYAWAWLVEASSIIPGVKQEIINNYQRISRYYKFLVTHDEEILNLAPNFVFAPSHGSLVLDTGIHKKSKLVSMISSNKRFVAGHEYRLEWVEKLKDKVDVFGKGINYIEKKEDGLNDYAFSVTIENASYPLYWSEKIIDCFVTGTVPIYHGDPGVCRYFNSRGIIFLNDDFDPESLSFEKYYEMMPAIKDNYERAMGIYTAEDWIVEQDYFGRFK